MKIKSARTPAATKIVAPKTKKCIAAKCCKVKTVPTVFTIHAEKGKAVYLAGEFNKWDPTAKKMAYKAKSGIYTATIRLAPGEYQYKFVVDGTWCADPENANSIRNDQGTFNSIITVK